jgi:hypothetical protein
MSGVELEGGSWMAREGPCFFDLRPIAEAIEFNEIPADFCGELDFERDHQFFEESDINNKGMWCVLRREGMHVVKDSVSWE